jgi:hypothetical protein
MKVLQPGADMPDARPAINSADLLACADLWQGKAAASAPTRSRSANRGFPVRLSLILQTGAMPRHAEIAVENTIIAGWTGRDPAAVAKHVRELEALGVKAPATTPIFYRVATARLTTGTDIEVVGDKSGGEVEFVLLQYDARLWVGAGSDHTDREVEAYGVTVSKQMCDKPLAPLFWAFDDVAPHWDRLMLRSHVTEDGVRKLYQEGSVAAMLSPQELIGRWRAGATHLPENTLMFCGTLAAKGGVRPTGRFEFELEDPVLGRTISHGYSVRTLPILG